MGVIFSANALNCQSIWQFRFFTLNLWMCHKFQFKTPDLIKYVVAWNIFKLVTSKIGLNNSILVHIYIHIFSIWNWIRLINAKFRKTNFELRWPLILARTTIYILDKNLFQICLIRFWNFRQWIKWASRRLIIACCFFIDNFWHYISWNSERFLMSRNW